ncbi:glutaminyl-peptide cyclotransferase [Contarinia nasturtii]|uniref:glutaminyl-peptide cyclotransferase n=1 Tax=Contarinia nasturtii TaxID=265458 RepID=UPI0012D45330|nr:glutaminyl-peptide cyclotransferase [Contarinia nasturtii]
MEFPGIWTICIIICAFGCRSVSNFQHVSSLRVAQQNHRPKVVDQQQFWELNNKLGDIEAVHNVLSKILVERVVGTPNHAMVREYIVNYMKNLGWTVDEHEFFDDTPLDRLKFTNIIAKVNPNAKRYLTLACHYDSKLMENFVGATDSAVPCAIMMNIATTLKEQFKSLHDSEISLQYIFFDGEEAFVEWNAKDSIYGARQLAKKWQAEHELDKIDLMILLDLLGAPKPTFYSYFPETEGWYYQMADIESRLGAAGQLVEHAHNSATIQHQKRNQGYFQPYSIRMQIEDDHIPFLRRDVRILHLIPTPFPEVWHTPSDDLRAIDFAAVTNLNKIIGIFLCEYLHIGSASTDH